MGQLKQILKISYHQSLYSRFILLFQKLYRKSFLFYSLTSKEKATDILNNSKLINLIYLLINKIKVPILKIFKPSWAKGIFILTGATIIYLLLFFIPPKFSWLILAEIFFIFIAWINIELASVLFFSFLVLSPKINFFYISPETFFLRIDDLLIISILIILLIKRANLKVKLPSTPLDAPLILYFCIGMLAIIRGLFIPTIDRPLMSFFYLLKNIEHILIFYLILSNLKEEKQIKLYIFSIFITAIIASLYGFYDHFHISLGTTAIFSEGFFSDQANNFAGYFLLMISLTSGMLLFSKKLWQRIGLGIIIALMASPFLWTLSRSAYIGLLISLMTMCWLWRKKHILILIILLILTFIISPPKIQDNVTSFLDEISLKDNFDYPTSFFNPRGNRWTQWKTLIKEWKNYPFLGTGFGSRFRSFYEDQYLMVLSETGLAGLVVFLWLLAVIFRYSYQLYYSLSPGYQKGIVLGFLGGLVGIIIHGFAHSVFIITRTIGPFWFIAAIIFFLGKLNLPSSRNTDYVSSPESI